MISMKRILKQTKLFKQNDKSVINNKINEKLIENKRILKIILR